MHVFKTIFSKQLFTGGIRIDLGFLDKRRIMEFFKFERMTPVVRKINKMLVDWFYI